MLENQSVIGKVLETETGKYITKNLFGSLERAIRNKAENREAHNALASISLIDEKLSSEFLEKVSERYLSFRTLLSRDADVFIDEIYHPLRIKRSSSDNEPISLIDNLSFEFPKIACIVGKAGQGKTTILRKLFLNSIGNDDDPFPLIITLRRLDWQDSKLSPARLVKDEFFELGIFASEEACSYLLQMNRLKVFFDGFDEIENEHRSKAIKVITETYTTFGTKCIVTTRPGTEIERFGGTIRNYTLMDLNREDAIKIIENHRLIGKQDKDQLLQVINTKKDITGILLTPILVDIFISTYNSLVAEPTTIIDFYEQLFQILASTHDRFKVTFDRNGKSGLNNFQLSKVFQTASFKLLNKKNDITFRNSDLKDAFNFACEKHGFDDAIGKAHDDVIDKTSLIKQDGLDYSYLHKSIIEFYAAKHIKELSDQSRKEYYQYILENYKSAHENILRFLSKIDTDLFYIIFVDLLIQNVKKHTSIYRQSCMDKLTIDTFLIGSNFDTIIVSKDEDGNVSFSWETELLESKRKIKDYFSIFFTVLDLPSFTVKTEVVENKIQNQIENGIDITSGLSRYKRKERIDSFKLGIEKVIDFSKDSPDIVSIQELRDFYNELHSLEDFIKRKEESYKTKNALDKFY